MARLLGAPHLVVVGEGDGVTRGSGGPPHGLVLTGINYGEIERCISAPRPVGEQLETNLPAKHDSQIILKT